MDILNKRFVTGGLVAAKLGLALAMLGHGALQAAPARGGYVAALAAPLAAPKQEIISGVLWKCAGERCVAPTDASRPMLVCQRVAKTFGQVARFTTPAGDLSSEDIGRCNGAS